jgi:hypothetical protein
MRQNFVVVLTIGTFQDPVFMELSFVSNKYGNPSTTISMIITFVLPLTAY